MLLHYLKYSPTGNITLLVTTPVPRADQPGLASRLLKTVGGEQVGFIEPAADPRCPARLQMMGGEFCGNATMSLGAMLAREMGLATGESLDLLLEVSGSESPVPCRITRCQGDGPADNRSPVRAACRRPPACDPSPAFLGTVDMPLPLSIDNIALPTDAGARALPMVAFPGITHLILPAEAAPGEAELRRRLPQWNQTLGADALGAITWDAAASSIDPLVYVPSAGTLVREHGCGSGTAAIGCALAAKAGSGVEASVAQPGGAIAVKVGWSCAGIAALAITGRVTLLEEGDVEI